MAAPAVTIAREDAQILAAKGLMFIANDQEVLGRFMSLTGLAPDDIRGAAGEPEFLAGILSFFMDHEAVLMAFAASAGILPGRVADAHLVLSGAPVWDG